MSNYPLFDNTKVDVDLLPAYEDSGLVPLERDYLKVEMLLSLIWVLVLLIVAAVIFVLLGEWEKQRIMLMIATPVFLLIGVLPTLLTYFGFRYKAYAVRERDILYQTGLIFRKVVILPFNRIQHSEVNNGPIDRMYNLASLKLFTAGGSSSDLSIPGLKEDRARRLKEFITRKTGLDEEE